MYLFDASTWSSETRYLASTEILDFVSTFLETALLFPPNKSFVNKLVKILVPIHWQKAYKEANHEQ